MEHLSLSLFLSVSPQHAAWSLYLSLSLSLSGVVPAPVVPARPGLPWRAAVRCDAPAQDCQVTQHVVWRGYVHVSACFSYGPWGFLCASMGLASDETVEITHYFLTCPTSMMCISFMDKSTI